MPQKESKSERNKRFAKIWSLSRSDAGKTQEYMASGLGVSKKTIQNWEKGVSAPDLYEGSEWFRVLGSNPMPYYLAFLYPWLFDGITPEDDDQDIEQTLLFLVKNMTAVEKREMLYLMAGRHGSPWYSMLQMFTAHCHCSLRSRVTAARTILENYEMDKACGAMVCPDNVQPDMKMLHHAVEEGKQSVFNQLSGYTNVEVDLDD